MRKFKKFYKNEIQIMSLWKPTYKNNCKMEFKIIGKLIKSNINIILNYFLE